jgi:hypothetical protein
MASLRVLITNALLSQRTGTETVVRDLALGLAAAGHQPMVYAPELGEIAREIADTGLPVVSRLAAIPQAPDVIHGQHHVPTLQALAHFPSTPGIFVCHDRLAASDVPPRSRRLLRFVAVDENCRERLVGDYEIPEHRVRVLYNSVDTGRFPARRPLPSKPVRALLFSNYAGPSTHLEPVQVACADLGLALDVVGAGVGRSHSTPEEILGQYDLVFAKARCALEAMAVGTAVVLCDARGLGPMVTTKNLRDLRPWNFGARLLREPLEAPRIAREVLKYDPADAAAVGHRIRREAALADSVPQYVALYQEVVAEWQAGGAEPADVWLEDTPMLLTRVAALERSLAAWQEPYRTLPLAEHECEQVRIVAEDAPSHVMRSEAFSVAIRLHNESSETLSGHPPCPIRLSYRWLAADQSRTVVADGPRSDLRSALASGQSARLLVGVAAPEGPGRYILRITLVQELVRWFDTLTRPVCVDLEVSVGSSHDS